MTLPFAFDYYGTSYSAVHVNSNMFLTFDAPPTGSEAWSNDCLDDTEPSNAVAVFWDDGVSHEDGPSSLWTKVEGTAPNRRFIIEYVNWGVFGPPPQLFYLDLKLNHQVVLYEDGDIEFRYGPRNAPGVSIGCGTQQSGCSATIGIEGTTPGQDTDLAYCERDDSAYDGLAIRFIHPSAPNAVPPAPVPGLTSRSTHVALALLLLAIGMGALVRSAWAPNRHS